MIRFHGIFSNFPFLFHGKIHQINGFSIKSGFSNSQIHFPCFFIIKSMGFSNDPLLLGAQTSPDVSHRGAAQRRPVGPATPGPHRSLGSVAGATEGRWRLG
jgi:hypothetical protein